MIFSAEAIAEGIDAMARRIAQAGLDDLLVVAVLKGSFVFAADLLRALHRAGLVAAGRFPVAVELSLGTTSSGRVEIVRDIEIDVRRPQRADRRRHSGVGPHAGVRQGPDRRARGGSASLTCVLLDKPVPRAAEIVADFKAFECPDVFVVGYGMDLAQPLARAAVRRALVVR